MVAFLAAVALAAHTYTVPQVRTGFAYATGVPLVRVASASTADVTTLSTRRSVTTRFGHFELYVLRPRTARATLRALYQGRKPNAQGVRWVPTQNVGVSAMTQFGTNLVVNWFPPGGKRRLDVRWRRLQTAVRAIR